MKFDELYNALVSEAPMSSFLTRLGKGVKAATPGVKQGAAELGKGVGSVVGTAAANIGKLGLGAAKLGASAVQGVASVPGAVSKARQFLIGQGGQPRFGDNPMGAIASGARQFKRGATKLQRKITNLQKGMDSKEAQNIRPKAQIAAGPKIEEFDKDVVKALIASQGAVKQAGMTSSGTTQAPGQITQGQVIASGMQGTTPPETSTAATTAKTTQSTLTKREPKAGDTFSLTDKFGKQIRYKVSKVENGMVSAAPISGSSAGV